MMKLPEEINHIIQILNKNGAEAYAVGGCVRDLLLGRPPKDWDICTNATPEEIIKIFPDNFYENKFGTVTILVESADENLRQIETTTYRVDHEYSDKRHPDRVKFTTSLKEDLARRDFTINALATSGKEVIDFFGGQKDLQNKVLRAVGDAKKRFSEDALRMMRAIRFSCELGFIIDMGTFEAIKEKAKNIEFVSAERIRDEFVKIIASDLAHEGIELLKLSGLLQYILPELEKGAGMSQNKNHIFDIYDHSVHSLEAAVKGNFSFAVRLAALLHDIGKPEVKQGEGYSSTFYNHDIVGAKFTKQILRRLKFPGDMIEKISMLIRNHMFISDPEKLTEAGARRLIKRVGLENIRDLINLRIADRLGMGRPKARPYRLRSVEYLIEKVSTDAVSVKMLNIDGFDLMRNLEIEPGPKIGAILDVLLSEVIDDPKKNTKESLLARAKELAEKNLDEIRESAKKVIEDKKEEEDMEIRKRYHIK